MLSKETVSYGGFDSNRLRKTALGMEMAAQQAVEINHQLVSAVKGVENY